MPENKSRKFIYHFFSKLFIISLFVFLLGAYLKTYAIVSPYQPGAMLDPGCAPTEDNCFVQIIPDQSGHAGQFLTTDGSVTSWAAGGGGSSGIDDVLAFGQSLTVNRSMNLSTHNYTINSTAYPTGLFFIDNSGAVQIGDAATSVNGTSVVLVDSVKEIDIRADNGTFFNNSTVSINKDHLGTTATDGLTLLNPTNAGVGAQQISPALHWHGNGWKTSSGGASQTVDFRSYILPVQALSAPRGQWLLQSSINGAGYSTLLSIDSNSTATFTGSVSAASFVTGGTIFATSTITTQGGLTLQGTTAPLILNASAGSSGQVLQSNGPGASPSWLTLSTGGNPIIASTSGVASFPTPGGTTETWIGGLPTASMGGASTDGTVFIGAAFGGNPSPGYGATAAGGAVFIGIQSGLNAINAAGSIFLGSSAGSGAFNASGSFFVGNSSGASASNANSSFFWGGDAGNDADNANDSIFLGSASGNQADNSSNAIFIGRRSGEASATARNSIFIGQQAGLNDSTNTTTDVDDYSILIGKDTSTNGNENSIAIGGSAINTASNQFMIGSTTRPINEMDIIGSGGQTCTVRPDTAGINCTSDENLKTNITDLTTTLDLLKNVRTVSYNWKNTPTTNPQIGFLAQNLKQYFPTLVSTSSNGYLQVNYGGMTPILVNAIKEMNIKIEGINNLDVENTFRDSLTAWLSNALNHITRIFTGEVCLTDPDGTSECINKTELHQLKQLLNTQTPPSNPPASPPVEPPPSDTPEDNPPTDTPPTGDQVEPQPPTDETPPTEIPPPVVEDPSN